MNIFPKRGASLALTQVIYANIYEGRDMKRRILSSVVSLGLASTGSAALALDSVKGGATGVRLSEDFLVALEMGGIQLSALEEAKIRCQMLHRFLEQ